MRAPGGVGAVLCVGRVYCDVILSGLPRLPSEGTEVFAEGITLRAGGGAYTTAAYLAALGRRAYLAAVLPAPPFGDVVRQDIAAAGIDVSACHEAEHGAEPQITVALTGAGDRSFVSRRSGPAAPELDDGFAARHGIGHLHIGELATLVAHPSLIDCARDQGVTISLDCGWDESLDPAQIAPLVAAVDVFLPNGREVAWLEGLGIRPGSGTLWIEKRGEHGARALEQPPVEAPADPAPVVDPTGAGDAFNAGFLDQWLGGAPLPDCLAAGNGCGAVAVGCVGGFDPDAARLRLAAFSH